MNHSNVFQVNPETTQHDLHNAIDGRLANMAHLLGTISVGLEQDSDPLGGAIFQISEDLELIRILYNAQRQADSPLKTA